MKGTGIVNISASTTTVDGDILVESMKPMSVTDSTVNGSIKTKGAAIDASGADVEGNVESEGGNIIASGATVGGKVDSKGGGVTVTAGTTVTVEINCGGGTLAGDFGANLVVDCEII